MSFTGKILIEAKAMGLQEVCLGLKILYLLKIHFIEREVKSLLKYFKLRRVTKISAMVTVLA